jgi:hypothetical protein
MPALTFEYQRNSWSAKSENHEIEVFCPFWNSVLVLQAPVLYRIYKHDFENPCAFHKNEREFGFSDFFQIKTKRR